MLALLHWDFSFDSGFFFSCLNCRICTLDGVKVAAVAVQGMPVFKICCEAWNCLLQAVVGAEQAIHSGATYSGEMRPAGKTIVLHPPC